MKIRLHETHKRLGGESLTVCPLHLWRVAQLYAISSESDQGEEERDLDHRLGVFAVTLLAGRQA